MQDVRLTEIRRNRKCRNVSADASLRDRLILHKARINYKRNHRKWEPDEIQGAFLNVGRNHPNYGMTYKEFYNSKNSS